MTSHPPSAEPADRAADRPTAPDRPGAGEGSADTLGVRPRARPAGIRRSPLLFRVAMILFFIGGLALLAVLVTFASGTRDFPLWLWLTVALAPIGLIVGSFGVGRAGSSLG
jgi:uncharacterized membrane protein YhdT